MPGFEYNLECPGCGLESESYPLLPFHQMFHGDLRLAVIDLELRAFGSLALYLSFEQRRGDGAVDPRAVAERWSGPGRIVVVPQGLGGRLWPEPAPCPACGAALVARSRVFER
jgi:hypothetical protein